MSNPEDKKRQLAVEPSSSTPDLVLAARPSRDEDRQKEGEREGRRHRHHHHSSSKSHSHHRHHHRDHSSHDRHDGSHRRHRHHHHKRHRSPSADEAGKSLVPYKTPQVAEKPPAAKEADQDLFVIDKRGDPLILQYGTNDRARVPEYRRYRSATGVLGAREPLVFVREGAREELTSRSYGDGGGSGSILSEKHHPLLSRAARPASKRVWKGPPPADGGLRAKEEEAEEEAEGPTDFVPLSTSHKRKRPSADEDSSSSGDDHGQLSYKSVVGKMRKRRDSLDSDDNSDSSAASDAGVAWELDNPAKKRSIELSRQVKDHPEDIDAWLELADLQDILFDGGNASDTRTSDEAKSLADIKLSLLESALPHAKSETDRERILVRLMGEGAVVWNPKQLAKRWQEVSLAHSDSFELWRARLNFEMTNISTFTFEGLRGFFAERLKFLREKLAAEQPIPASETSTPSEDFPLLRQLIYVFLRMARFLHDAGYAELAVAAWQAQLETAFARPPGAAFAEHVVAMASLRDFWESEVPRIGEEGAKGWRHFAENPSEPGDPPLPAAQGQQQQSDIPPPRDKYKAWQAAERQRTLRSKMPARTLDEEADVDDDPFRVVLFSDIEDLLFEVPQPALAAVREQLIDSFLIFCRLPPAFGSSSWVRSARNDPFIASYGAALLTPSSPVVAVTAATAGLADISSQSPPQVKRPDFSLDGGQAALCPEILFPGPDWFRYLPSWLRVPANTQEVGEEEDETLVSPAWVATTLRQLVRAFGFEALAPYSLAVDWAAAPGGVKKAARALLKIYPSNSALYNAYALAELANGNADVAEKVLASATRRAPDSTAAVADMPLWHTWAWMELETENKKRAASRLCASVGASSADEGAAPSPTQLLAARQKILAGRDYQLSAGDPDASALFARSHVLLEYLTAPAAAAEESVSHAQGNVSAAMAAAASFSAELEARGLARHPAHERLLQFAARVLYFHARHGPYRPIYIREQLLRAVRLFPRNTLLLALFAWAEPSLRALDDGVRAVLHDVVFAAPQPNYSKSNKNDEGEGESESGDCPSTRAFAIRHELARLRTITTAGSSEVVGGSPHAARAAFEHALSSSSSSSSSPLSSSPDLWRAYIRFCASHAQTLRRGAAREVFYRAVRACPWSKALVSLAFSSLPPSRDEEDEGRGGMEASELGAAFATLQAKGLRVHVDLGEFLEAWERRRGKKKVGIK